MIPKINRIGLILILIASTYCSDSKENNQSGDLTADTGNNQEEILSSNLSESLESISESNISNGSVILSLQNEGGNGKGSEKDNKKVNRERVRTCLVDGNETVVNTTSNYEGGFEKILKNKTFTRFKSGTSEIAKIWTQDGGAVPCHENGRTAQIDWDADSITGLSLLTTVQRSKFMSSTSTKGDKTRSSERTMTVSGSKTVQWFSHTDNDDGTFTRLKTVTTSTNRTVDAKLNNKTISFSIESQNPEGEELVVSVTRNSADKSLISVQINSGAIRSVSADGSVFLSRFTDYLVTFDNDGCAVQSGTIKSQTFATGSTEPTRTLELTAIDGEITVNDITNPDAPVLVEDFEYEFCDAGEFD